MAKPITKMAYAVKKAEEISQVFDEAWQIALSGRPGPVLIDLPMNIQNQEIEFVKPKLQNSGFKENTARLLAFFQNYIDALKNSKRPLVLVGRGIRSSGTVEQFQQFIQRYQIPVVTSLLGFDVLPYKHQQRVGFIGTYGNRWANYTLGSCDLLLVLGSRLDLRQTGSDIESFQHGKQVYHVDIDQAELNNRITECTVLEYHLSVFFSQIEHLDSTYQAPTEWVSEIEEKKQTRLDSDELANISGINPNVFIHQLAKKSDQAKAFTTDVGNNQMWSSQSLELNDYQLLLTSGGMGVMGYALPAAIGASITLGNAPVVCIAGDGGFQINIQELQTIRRNNLPVKIVILNNHCLGMIRQFQDSYFDSCYQSTVWGYNAPNFAQVALAYGIESYSISKPEEAETGLAKLWEDSTQPFLLDVSMDIHTNVFPKMMFGSPITEMEPKVQD